LLNHISEHCLIIWPSNVKGTSQNLLQRTYLRIVNVSEHTPENRQ